MAKKFLDSTGVKSLWQKVKSTFVAKESGKGLSTNDYTSTEKTKLEGIATGANLYVHPTTTAHDTGLYKIQTNVQGHVVEAEKVIKKDILDLGISDPDNKQNKITGKQGQSIGFDKDGNVVAVDKVVSAETADTLSEALPIELGGTGATNATFARYQLQAAKDAAFIPSTANTIGVSGLVPAPRPGDENKFLKGNGTWETPPDTKYTLSAATATALGGVIIGDNITNASGKISITSGNVTGALGFTPLSTTGKAASATIADSATTATKLAAAKSLKVALGSTTAVTFDGSAAQDSIPVSGTLLIANGGTGMTSNPSILVDLTSSGASNVFQATPRPGVSGILPIANGGTGAANATTALSNLGALPLTGGTLTGTLFNSYPSTDNSDHNIRAVVGVGSSWGSMALAGSGYTNVCYLMNSTSGYGAFKFYVGSDGSASIQNTAGDLTLYRPVISNATAPTVTLSPTNNSNYNAVVTASSGALSLQIRDDGTGQNARTLQLLNKSVQADRKYALMFGETTNGSTIAYCVYHSGNISEAADKILTQAEQSYETKDVNVVMGSMSFKNGGNLYNIRYASGTTTTSSGSTATTYKSIPVYIISLSATTTGTKVTLSIPSSIKSGGTPVAITEISGSFKDTNGNIYAIPDPTLSIQMSSAGLITISRATNFTDLNMVIGVAINPAS